MASLNTSTNGPSIKSSYQSVIDGTFAAGSSSPTFGLWVVFSVSTPLINAFQPDRGGKESVLRVQSTAGTSFAEGELHDMIEEFSEGRIQFAFVKIKDSNTSLPKCVLIGWCGEGVPERTKGYFTSHLAAVSKMFHGYHVQITARSDRDLTPESIVKKVADASGAKYTQISDPSPSAPPVTFSKPVLTPKFNRQSGPTGTTSSPSRYSQNSASVDDDGWGLDAPQITRSQLEKVAPAYKPTKVNMAELIKQKPVSTQLNGDTNSKTNSDVVKGGYQPIGKVDIAAIRAQAQNKTDDRPTVVKGVYEPVGKVDIAAIRAKAQKPTQDLPSPINTFTNSDTSDSSPKTITLAEKSSAFSKSERLTTLPKPKVTNRFSNTTSNYKGTKAPQPGRLGSGFTSTPFVPPIGTASKNFADENGKTPAQMWQEKKARERGLSGASSITSSQTSRNVSKTNTDGEWKSNYTGKLWAPVDTNPTGRSSIGCVDYQRTGDKDKEQESRSSPISSISAIRTQFQGGIPSMANNITQTVKDSQSSSQPPINTSTRPTQPVSLSPLEVRSPTPDSPQRETSPIRIAMPVARLTESETKVMEELEPYPQDTAASIEKEDDKNFDIHNSINDIKTPETTKIQKNSSPDEVTDPPTSGKTALIEYDYEIIEDNEIQLVQGEYVTNIEMVDTDWWMGTNSKGETGLFPSNYVKLVDEVSVPDEQPDISVVALYDYEAAEDNELSFNEDAVITNVEFPDKDWWFGYYDGKSGLFPANYVKLNE